MIAVDGFSVLAEPTRRRILDELRAAQEPDETQSGSDVATLVSSLELPQPTVSKHLRVLRDAGVVVARVDGPRRIYRLSTHALGEVAAWLRAYDDVRSKASMLLSGTSTRWPTREGSRRTNHDRSTTRLSAPSRCAVRRRSATVRMERDIPHSPDLVWAALTKADHVRRWAPYAPARDLDVVGDVDLPQSERGEPAEGSSVTGQVLEADQAAIARAPMGRSHRALRTHPDRPRARSSRADSHLRPARRGTGLCIRVAPVPQRTPGPPRRTRCAGCRGLGRSGIRLASSSRQLRRTSKLNNAQFATYCCSWPATPKLVSRHCD